jgi:hypothetical protein
MQAELFGDSFDLREPGAQQREKTIGECCHRPSHALPAPELVQMAAGPFEHQGSGAQAEGISGPQEREYGHNQGALPPVQPVELIIEVPDRAPSVPEVRIRSQGGGQPLRAFVHPSAVDLTQRGAKRRRAAQSSRTKDPFGREDGAAHEFTSPQLENLMG